MVEGLLWAAQQDDTLFELEFDPSYINAMGLLNHYHRLPLICEWYGRGDLSPDDLNRLLAENWTHGGYPYDMGWKTSDFVEMFRYAEFVTDAPEIELPTDPITVWRGGAPGAVSGLSWSTERSVGEFFAKRNVWKVGRAELWTGSVPPSDVLGFFTGRNEAEIVSDPNRVVDVTTVVAFTGEPAERVSDWV